jgi:ABC-type sugar transport system substrate-binding protein/class 3 adenylate cyclase
MNLIQFLTLWTVFVVEVVLADLPVPSNGTACFTCLQKEDIRVLVVLPSIGYVTDAIANGVKVAAAELNITVSIKVADGDVTRAARDLAPDPSTNKYSGAIVHVTKSDPAFISATNRLATHMPVIALNAAYTVRTPTVMHDMGMDEAALGELAAQRLRSMYPDRDHLICIIEDAYLLATSTRCGGAQRVFAGANVTTIVSVDGQNKVQALSVLTAVLQKKGLNLSAVSILGTNIDGTLTALYATQTIDVTNIPIGAIEVNSDILALLQSRTLQFAVDTVPFNHGYYAMHLLFVQIRTGNHLLNEHIQTGSTVLTPDNINQYKILQCLAMERTLVFCPAIPTTPGCNCVNRTNSVQLSISESDNPYTNVFKSIIAAGIFDYTNSMAVTSRANFSYTYLDNYDPFKQAGQILKLRQGTPNGFGTNIQAQVIADAVKGLTPNVPLFIYNAGMEFRTDVNPTTYVGADQFINGKVAGETLAKLGVRHALCVNQGQGKAIFATRCRGVNESIAAVGSEMSIVYTATAANIGLVRQQVAAAFDSAATPFDGVVVLGGALAQAVIDVFMEKLNGRRVPTVVFDINNDVARLVTAGQITHAMFEQPYLQGYVLALFLSQGGLLNVSVEETWLQSGPRPMYSDVISKFVCEQDRYPICPPRVLPSNYHIISNDSPLESTGFIAGIAVVGGMVLLLLVLSGWMIKYWGRTNVRDVRHAPKDETQNYVIIFTDIESSSALWAHIPIEMHDALHLHHSIIRSLIAAHNAYEVKTIGDSFMIACTDVAQGVNLACAIQEKFQHANWSPLIASTYKVLAAQKSGESSMANPMSPNGGLAFHPLSAAVDLSSSNLSNSNSTLGLSNSGGPTIAGLRVRIGIHYGHGDIVFDKVAKGYDYYGTVVNTAARVEAAGHGGQIVTTEAVFDTLRHSRNGASNIPCLGTHDLRGVGPVKLFQVNPPCLRLRSFPALRVEEVIELDDTSSQLSEDHPSTSVPTQNDFANFSNSIQAKP